jgi:ADP-ribose pyrophosphatase YjhB (NUDIX family)
MYMFSHNVYDNVRTRVIVVNANRMLLLEPENLGDGWRLPGGGLEMNESLADCGEREVMEETGIAVKVTNVAFLREFVIPKYCTVPEGNTPAYSMEVYLYGHTIDDALAPRRENPQRPDAHWIPLDQVSALPLWPKELKTLAALLATNSEPFGAPSFVSKLESPDTPAPNVNFT